MRIALPRLRIDQMLNFNWKFLTPLALVLLMVTAVVEKSLIHFMPSLNFSASGFLIFRSLVLLLTNILIIVVTAIVLRTYARRERMRVSQPRPVAVTPEPPASVIS
jgi:hypothetical protein